MNPNEHLKVANNITKLLDNQFSIFGFKIGIDPLLGLIPGIGDAISVALSFYLVWIAISLKLPQQKIVQMISNIAIDFLIGLLPVVGDLSDFIYKANSKNMKILQEYTNASVIEGEIVE